MRGLQNENLFSNVIIENQMLECLQGVKSVNPEKIENATHFLNLCAKVLHFNGEL
jgi:hypothetical protein